MVLIHQAIVGPYELRLRERPGRFYFTCRCLEEPWLTVVAFLGGDHGHSIRQFERRRDNQLAAIEAENEYG